MQRGGKTMVDAKRKLGVLIIAEDVDSAEPTDPGHCAVAQSLRRREGIESVSVGASMVYVIRTANPNIIERYAISPNDRAMIREFDKQGLFPCGYKVILQPPPPTRKLGARAGKRSGTEKRTGKRKNAVHRVSRSTPTRHVAAPV